MELLKFILEHNCHRPIDSMRFYPDEILEKECRLPYIYEIKNTAGAYVYDVGIGQLASPIPLSDEEVRALRALADFVSVWEPEWRRCSSTVAKILIAKTAAMLIYPRLKQYILLTALCHGEVDVGDGVAYFTINGYARKMALSDEERDVLLEMMDAIKRGKMKCSSGYTTSSYSPLRSSNSSL